MTIEFTPTHIIIVEPQGLNKTLSRHKLSLTKYSDHVRLHDDTREDGESYHVLRAENITSPNYANNDELYENLKTQIASPSSDPTIDAGNRKRVSQITTLLDIKQVNDNAPLFYDRVNGNGATQTYQSSKGGTDMAVTGDTQFAVCQSFMFAPYYSGKGQFGEITFSGMNHDANVVKRAGYYSSSTSSPFDTALDGLWFESDGESYRFKIQNNGTSVLNVPQSEWNINRFQDHDFSKFNVLVFQFLYLGGTAIKFGFIQNGVITWAHVYVHAGLVENTFVKSPSQPVRYEIRSTGGSGSFTQICAQVASEGSIDEVGVQRGIDNGATYVNANAIGTFYALCGVRLKTAYRNVRVQEQSVSITALTNDAFVWRLIQNPTVAGTFTYNDLTNSSLQVALGDTVTNPSPNTVTGGRVVASGNGAGNSGITDLLISAIRIGSKIDGTSDQLVLAVTPLAVNLDVTGTLNIKEFI